MYFHNEKFISQFPRCFHGVWNIWKVTDQKLSSTIFEGQFSLSSDIILFIVSIFQLLLIFFLYLGCAFHLDKWSEAEGLTPRAISHLEVYRNVPVREPKYFINYHCSHCVSGGIPASLMSKTRQVQSLHFCTV